MTKFGPQLSEQQQKINSGLLIVDIALAEEVNPTWMKIRLWIESCILTSLLIANDFEFRLYITRILNITLSSALETQGCGH